MANIVDVRRKNNCSILTSKSRNSNGDGLLWSSTAYLINICKNKFSCQFEVNGRTFERKGVISS